jgi:hypothetical protein
LSNEEVGFDNADLNRYVYVKTESSYFGYLATIALLLAVNAAPSVYVCRLMALPAHIWDEAVSGSVSDSDSDSGRGSTVIWEES